MGEVTYIDEGPRDRALFLGSTLGPLAVIVAVTIIAYWPAFAELWVYWTEEPSLGGHGPLVVLIALCLSYRSRMKVWLAPPSRAGSKPALALLVLCSIACVILWKAGIQSLQLLLVPALMLLGVWAALGGRVARIIVVPIGYLLFAMPAWNLLSVPLQTITLWAVRFLAPLVGLPATVNGTVVALPDGSLFEVTLACSGIGFLVQGLAVATLIGELEDAPVRRRLNLLGGVAAVALATNWIRVLLLLWLGYSSGMRNVLATRNHLQFGYLVFVLALVAYVWVVSRRASTAPASSPMRNEVRPIPGAAYARAVGGLVIVPIAAFLAGLLQSHRAVAASPPPPPLALAQWEGPLPSVDLGWQPVFLGAEMVRQVVYRNAAHRDVELLEVGYPTQEQGRELVNEENSLIGASERAAVSGEVVNSSGRTYRQTTTVDSHGNRAVIWSYYEIGSRRIVTPVLSQLWYGVLSLYSSPYSRLMAVRAQCQPSCAEARATLAEFAQASNLSGGTQS